MFLETRLLICLPVCPIPRELVTAAMAPRWVGGFLASRPGFSDYSEDSLYFVGCTVPFLRAAQDCIRHFLIRIKSLLHSDDPRIALASVYSSAGAIRAQDPSSNVRWDPGRPPGGSVARPAAQVRDARLCAYLPPGSSPGKAGDKAHVVREGCSEIFPAVVSTSQNMHTRLFPLSLVQDRQSQRRQSFLSRFKAGRYVLGDCGIGFPDAGG